MVYHAALLGALLVAGQASAKVNALFPRGNHLEDRLARDAESMMATLTVRQDANNADSAPQVSTTPQSGDASEVNLQQWEAQTREACQNALSELNGQASNPSGIAVCYNLPFLDNSTGVFQAELRMYNISAPIDPWQGVTAADVSMTLSYLGATVQSTNGTFVRRDEPESADGILVERLVENLGKRQDAGNGPAELKVLNYVGKINDNLMGSAMTE